MKILENTRDQPNTRIGVNIFTVAKRCVGKTSKGILKDDLHTSCRAHAVPLSCRAAKDLEYVFPI